MLDLNVSQFDIATQLRESVEFTRVDLSNDSTGNTTLSVATGVLIVILPATTQGNQVQGTGRVIIEGFYDGTMLTPNSSIKIGDVLTRAVGIDPQMMYVLNVNTIANVQWMRLSTTRQ
jgi:hypothetical protein